MNEDSVARFWDNFIQKSKRSGVRVSAIRWHVLHAEAYIKAHPRLRLSARSGKRPYSKDRQFKQVTYRNTQLK